MLCGFETPCFQIISDRKLGVRLFYFCLLCLSSASNKSRLSPIWRSYKTVMSFMASTKCGISNHHSSSHTFNRIMISIDLQMWNYKQPGWHHLCWIFFFAWLVRLNSFFTQSSPIVLNQYPLQTPHEMFFWLGSATVRLCFSTLLFPTGSEFKFFIFTFEFETCASLQTCDAYWMIDWQALCLNTLKEPMSCEKTFGSWCILLFLGAVIHP